MDSSLSYSPDCPLFAKRVSEYDGEIKNIIDYIKNINKSM